jgi:hypothetical protein
MVNGSCRMHSGVSTGPRTAEGLARSRRARWKHALYSAEALAEQKRVRELLAQSRELLKQMRAGSTGGFTAHGLRPWNSACQRRGVQTKTPQTHLSPLGRSLNSPPPKSAHEGP